MDIDQLKNNLKKMIVDECDKDIEPEEITDTESLIRGPVAMDSLDVLQVCMAIKNTYGVRIEGSAAARKAFKSINALAEIIQTQRT